MKPIFRKLVTESSLYSTAPILRKFVAFLLIPLYTAYLTPSDYGQLEYIITISGFFMIFASGGLQSGFFRYGYTEVLDTRKTVLFNCLISFFILSIFIFLISFFIKDYLFDNIKISYLFLIYLIGAIINELFSYNLLVLRYQHKAKQYVIISIFSFLFVVTLNIILIVYFKLGFIGIIYSNLISSTIVFLIFSKLLYNEIIFKFDTKVIKNLFKFGLPLVPGNIAYLLMTMSDRYFLKHFSTTRELGLYSYGFKFGSLLSALVIIPFFLGWGPYKWQIFKQENAKQIYREVFLYFSNAMLIIVILFTIVTTFVGSVMSSNPEFRQGLSIVPIILGSFYFLGITNFQSLGVLFKEKTYFVSISLVISAIINVILNRFLIPHYGMVGASYASLISSVCYFFIFFAINQKYYYVSYHFLNLTINICFIIVYSSFAFLVKRYNENLFYFSNLIIFAIVIIFFVFRFKNKINTVIYSLKRHLNRNSNEANYR